MAGKNKTKIIAEPGQTGIFYSPGIRSTKVIGI